MTILYVCSGIFVPHRSGPGLGGSTHALEVAHHLTKAGTECYLVCARGSETQSNFELLGEIPVFRIFGPSRVKRILKYFAPVWRLVRIPFHLAQSAIQGIALIKLVRGLQIELIYERSSNASLAGLFAAIFSGRPYVLELNDQNVTAFALRWCKNVVTPYKGVLPQRYHSKVLQLHWGVNTNVFKPGLDCEWIKNEYDLHGRQIVVFVGSGMHWHGLDLVIASAKQVLKHIPKAHFLLVDGNSQRNVDLRRRAAELDVDTNCTFTDFVQYDEVPAYINAAEIALAPYTSALCVDQRHRYASPMKILEYFACGKPVIVTEAGNYNGLVEHGINGAVVANDSPDALAGAIIRLLEDQDGSSRMGQNALQIAQKKYSWAVHCEQLVQAFSNAIPTNTALSTITCDLPQTDAEGCVR